MLWFTYQPSVPFEKLVPMLKWRVGTLRGHTPRSLAASLTVEGLPYDTIPPKHYNAVKGFRRRNHQARAALCRRLAGALSAEILRDDIVPTQHQAALQAWREGRHDPIAYCQRYINERDSPCGR